MSVRNYRAYTMSEALAAVKSDLGPDAVVLHTRTFTQGGFLGFGRKTVVEVMAAAASELDAERGSRSQAEGNAGRTGREPRTPAAAVATRAYAASGAKRSNGAAEVVVSPSDIVETLDLDRERTRLLAQAMAVKLEREQMESPRTSAASAATANASATAQASRQGNAAQQSPVSPVAQRYVLVPAATASDRQPAAKPAPRALPIESRVEMRRDEQPPAAPPVPPSASSIRPAEVPVSAPDDDLDAIGRLVGDVLRRGGLEASRPGRLAELYTSLIAQEVGDEIADRIVEEVRAALTAEELANDHAVRSAAVERMAALLPRCETLVPSQEGRWRRGDRPLTIAFVGPTGVGKTTTVAKIAATLKLRHGARIALITCDTYRIAAVDQLRTYAEIIGVPLEVVLSPGHMHQACRKLADADVVLIDTAGRSQNDSERIGDLQSLLDAAEPHETHLVLSSVASEKAMLREAEAFAAVGVDRVVLTKLDEAAGLGATLRVLRKVGRSLSYLTTGQEVPQHIEAARPQRLAELMLGGVTAS